MGRYKNTGLGHGTKGSPQTTIEQLTLATKVDALYDKIINNEVKISVDDQTKHIEGSKNYDSNKSKFYGTVSKAQKLIKTYKGKGEKINDSKERVDFGEIIGEYVDSKGNRKPTTIGIIHHSDKKGDHIVPARPKENKEEN